MSSNKFTATEGKNQQGQKSSGNAEMFTESWDAWDAVPSSPSHPQLQQVGGHPPQGELPNLVQENVATTQSQEVNVDALLADFLAPEQDLPSVTGTFSPVLSTSRPENLTTPQQSAFTPAAGVPAADFVEAIPSGLNALEHARSSGEWKRFSTGSFDSFQPPTPQVSPRESADHDWSVGNIGGQSKANLAQVAAERRRERKAKRDQLHRDQKTAGLKAILWMGVRLLIFAGICYGIYFASQNGI